MRKEGIAMARRPAWTITEKGIEMQIFDFVWNSGLNIKQKQKNIQAAMS